MTFNRRYLQQAIGVPQFRIWIYAEPGIAAAEVDPGELRRAFVDQVRPEDLVVIVGAERLNAKTV
jgi:hypothetical protein